MYVRITQCNIIHIKIYKQYRLYILVMLTYNTDQYAEIGFDINGYTLPSHVITAITNLAETLNVNVSITTTSIIKSPMNGTRPVRRPKNSRDINSEWKNNEPFKTTDTIQYVGFEKKIADIRTGLNKLSNKNYDTIRDSIYDHINTILNGEEGVNLSDDNTGQIVNCIFDIASNNGFYAELYALLYKDLIKTFAFFENTAENSINRYMQSIELVRYEDSDGDYDLHCVINKENDSRKSLLTFIIMLIRGGILPLTSVNTLVDHLDGLMLLNMSSKSHVFINNEIIENYSVLITKMIPDIFTLDTWSSIYERVKAYTTYNTKEYLGLSSRAKFKFMDIKELVSKKLSA